MGVGRSSEQENLLQWRVPFKGRHRQGMAQRLVGQLVQGLIEWYTAFNIFPGPTVLIPERLCTPLLGLVESQCP